MKTDLGTGYVIEGFDSHESELVHYIQYCDKSILYGGKTSEIPEDIARKCVKIKGSKGFYGTYINTGISSKDRIQLVCTKPYCIIYKQK